MKAERLLELYDRISEAPDAVSRLRRFVLDLAVRGKLVDQDPEDEAASELLEWIAAEKTRLARAGMIKKPKPLAPIDTANLPIDVPAHWVWARLCEIGALSGGMTPSKARPDYWNGDLVWLSPKDIKADEVSESELKITAKGLSETRLELFPAGSLFIVARSGILKRTFPVAINRVPAASNQDLKVLVPFLKGQERYLQIMFRGMTDFLLTELVKTGTTVQSLKYAEFETQPFPIPPLAEQHRIVAKVDELMTLCDRLEEQRATREATRDRLTTATLSRLTTPDTDEQSFRNHTRFALETLRALTSRSDQIKALRQTILDLAVRGKLVIQDPEDGISTEISTVPTENQYFDTPKNWSWVYLGDVAEMINGDRSKNYPNRNEYQAKGVPWINTGHIRPDGSLDLPNMHYISRDKFNSLGSGKIQTGDLLYCLRGATFGKTGFVEPFEEGAIASSLMIIRPGEGIDRRYASFFLISPAGKGQLLRFDNGTAQPNLSAASVRKYAMPLPPVREQHRIVAKVDELMALCDRLEACLQQADNKRARLLESLLAEALAPAEETLEAA